LSYKKYINFDGLICEEWRNDAGELHREDGPASTCYHKNGLLKWQTFYFKNQIHRELEPANITYYCDGSINKIQYWFLSSLHREDGPSKTNYNCDGQIEWEQFHIYGVSLGCNEKGFWALWGNLTDDQRKSHSILSCLARYS